MPKVFAVHKTGFRIELDDVAHDRLDDAVDWLTKHGYKPDRTNGDPWQRTPDGLPICPRHGMAMSKRERQGDSWFSYRVIDPQSGEERFCRGYPNASSAVDGYNL